MVDEVRGARQRSDLSGVQRSAPRPTDAQLAQARAAGASSVQPQAVAERYYCRLGAGRG